MLQRYIIAPLFIFSMKDQMVWLGQAGASDCKCQKTLSCMIRVNVALTTSVIRPSSGLGSASSRPMLASTVLIFRAGLHAPCMHIYFLLALLLFICFKTSPPGVHCT